MIRVQHRRRGTTEWKDIDFTSFECTPKTLDFSVPSARLLVSNRNGRYSTKFRSRDEFRIETDEGEILHGVMTEDTKTVLDQMMEIYIAHKDYQRLVDKICSDNYKSEGTSAWKWGSSTQIGSSVVGGLRPDQIFQAGIGVTFFVQTFFETNAVILTFNDTLKDENTIKLTKNVASGTESFVDTGDVVIQSLHNTLAGYDSMPDIRDVIIRLAGEQPADTSLDLEISRDDGTNVVLKTPTYASGVWTTTVTEAEWASTGVRNRLAIKIILNGDGAGLSSPIIRSLFVEGDISDDDGLGDTGIKEGTVNVYTNPEVDEDEIGGDFSWNTRLQVCTGAVKAAATGSGELYPTFYAFIEDGAAHFRDPAGYGTDRSDVAVFSREGGTCEDIKVMTKGADIINNLVYISQGVAPLGTTITTTTPDPDSVALYGEIQGVIQEKAVSSGTWAGNRAMVLAKHLPFPQQGYEIINPDKKLFELLQLGDKARIVEKRYNANAVLTVIEKSYSYSADGGMMLSLLLSNNKFGARNFMGQIAQNQQDNNNIGQGSMSPPSISFQDNFDEDHPVELAVYVPSGKLIRSVLGYFKSSKFRADSASAASADTAEFFSEYQRIFEPEFTSDTSGSPNTSSAIVPTALTGDYSGVVVTVEVANNSGSTDSYDFKIRNETTATDLTAFTSVSVGNGERAIRNVSYDSDDVSGGDQLSLVVTDGVVGTDASSVTLGYVKITIQTKTTHQHEIVYRISEFAQYPEGVKLYIQNYPNPTDNEHIGDLTAPFGSFGVRGTDATSFEIPNIDLSQGFRDAAGDFRSGQVVKLWLTSQGTTANPDGLGRMTAHIMMELLEGVDTK